MKKNKQKYVLVKGICGLGNRLMTLATAIEYCRITGRILCVDWTDGMFTQNGEDAFQRMFFVSGIPILKENLDLQSYTCYPTIIKKLPKKFKMEDYFICYDYNDQPKLVRMGIDALSSIVHKLGSEDMFRRFFILWVHWYIRDGRLKKKFPRKDILTLGSNMPYNRKEEIICYADFAPEYKPEVIRKYIHLNDEMLREVNSFVYENDLERHSLGIHIRDTDKQSKSDYKKLIVNIRKFIEKEQIKKVFLATDQLFVKKIFAEEFKDKLICYDKFLPELESGCNLGIHLWAEQNKNTSLREKMYHDSIMDMWLLSKVSFLWYQGNSTFSTISRDLRNNKECLDWQKIKEL